MNTTIPTHMQTAIDDVVDALGPTFSIDQFVSYIEQCRGVRVIIEEKPFALGVFGLCFSLCDADVVRVTPGMPRQLWLITVLHELVHLLRNHLKERFEITYEQFVQRDTSGVSTLLRSAVGDYKKEQEDEAETIATVFLSHVNAYETHVSMRVHRMYDNDRI